MYFNGRCMNNIDAERKESREMETARDIQHESDMRQSYHI